jgi:hypothetical protein
MAVLVDRGVELFSAQKGLNCKRGPQFINSVKEVQAPSFPSSLLLQDKQYLGISMYL